MSCMRFSRSRRSRRSRRRSIRPPSASATRDNRTIDFQRQLTPPIVYQAYSPLGDSDWDPFAPTVKSIAAKHSRTAALVGLRYWVYPARLAVGQASLNPQHLAVTISFSTSSIGS